MTEFHPLPEGREPLRRQFEGVSVPVEGEERSILMLGEQGKGVPSKAHGGVEDSPGLERRELEDFARKYGDMAGRALGLRGSGGK